MTGYTYGNLMRVCDDESMTSLFSAKGEYGWDGWLGTFFSNEPAHGITLLFGTQQAGVGRSGVLVRKIKNIVAIATVAVMAFSMAGCKMIEKTPEAIQKTVLAKVGDEKITMADVNSELQADIDYLTETYGEDYENNIDDTLKKKYEMQYKNVTFINNNKFHDRFIIIDKDILYTCGSSFKDLGKKCFYIGLIEDREILNKIISKLTNVQGCNLQP